MSPITIETDVLICGGGPAGLLTAYCLSRYGIATTVIEKHSQVKKVQYGRGILLMPRTLELLDQLDLADALNQIGFVSRGRGMYKNGKRLEGFDVTTSIILDTFLDYILLIRQRWTEQVIADAYTGMERTSLRYGTTLVELDVKQDGAYSTVETQGGQRLQIRSKYVVGADGGHSTVRELAGIAFEGEKSNSRWVRVDGIVETDMPESRSGVSAIISESHGTVLWAALDHGATRVGFALPEQRWGAGENITLEDCIFEAKEALKPFSLEFKTVDWWTVYSIGQRLAGSYRAKERILIVGDAAHTHSSGAAQGMNTGLQDAVNLAWKLAGRIHGHYADSVLDTYSAERRTIAAKIIAQDKIISLLTEGKIPAELQDDPEKDPNKLLSANFVKNQHLNTGLGVAYPEDDLTIVQSTAGVALKIKAGERALDVLLQKPGIRLPIRLYSQTRFYGRFTVLVFCGDLSKTQDLIKTWRVYLDSVGSVLQYEGLVIDFITILVDDNFTGAAEETLGVPRYGQILYDVDKSAHERYGIAEDKGAVLILRPDGLLGTACALDKGQEVSAYFARFLTIKGREDLSAQTNGDSAPIIAKGEVEIE